MPAAVTAFVAFVGGWGAAIALVISVAAGIYSVTAMRKMGDTQQERKQILRASAAPLNIIFGVNRSAGVMACADEAKILEQDLETGLWHRGKKDGLFLAVTHAGHPLHKVEHYQLNGEALEDFGDTVKIITYKDGASAADPTLLNNLESWKDDMIGQGFAWYAAQLAFDQKKFPNGAPNINALKWGWEMPDPRTGQTAWSDNAAVCILFYLKQYLGYEDDELIIETFISAANVCDEFVTLPDGNQERRYRLGAEFNIDEEPASILARLLSTCGGEWVRVGGRLGLSVAAYYGPAVISIDESDLIGDIELQPEVERQDSINTVRGKFISPEQNYTEVDFPQVSVPEYVSEDGEEIISDLDLLFVQSPWQAQRLAHITIMRNRFGMTMRLPCNLRGFKAVPGSLIRLSLDCIGLKNQEFRVLDWEFSLEDGVVLLVRRDVPAMYDDAVGEALDVPPFISGAGDVAVPTNLRFETSVEQNSITGIIRWENKAAMLSHTVAIITKAGDVKQTVQIPSPGESFDLGGLVAGNYEVNLKSVTVAGRESSSVALAVRLDVPVPPTHADADVSSESITLMPHIGDDSQVSVNTLYEFYFNAIDDETTAQRLGQGQMLTKQGLAADSQYWFWVYTITPLGKSATPLALNVKTGLVSGDIIEHIDNEVEKQVAAATEDLLKQVGSLTDIRGIAEDLDAQIIAENLANGLSEIEAEKAAQRVARLMQSVTELSTDQQSLVEQVISLYAKFDEQVALVQTKDRAQVGYSLKPDGSPGQATTPQAAEQFGELWVPGKALAESVKLVGIVTDDGRSLTVSQYFSALEKENGELSARAFLGVDHNGRTTGIGITSDETGEVTFQAINFIADLVSITSPDDPTQMLLWYDTRVNQLTVRGKMVLGDGYVVDGESAIRAQDGGTWETRYKMDSTPPDTPTGRYPVGWGTAMPSASGSSKVYATTAFINANDTLGVTWSVPGKISGDDGAPGQNGVTTYTWIKYADNASGSGLSNDPTGKEYIGFAYNKTTATESSNAADYKWSKAKGDKGVPGEPGEDGQTTYTWIKYSDNANGSGLYDTPKASTQYIGIAVNKTTASESSTPSHYVWSKFKGDQGVPGNDGVTTYTWIKYANNASGSGLSNDPTGKDYIGFAYNKTTATESTNAADYKWSKATGDKGVPGEKGDDGQTTYTWIKYSDNANGSGLYDTPKASTQYIGIAVNKTTASESSTPSHYVWSKFKGEQGVPGNDGRPGNDGAPGNDGHNGSGFYRLINSSGNWPGDGAANGLFKTAFGRYPVIDDVLTFFKADGSVSTTRRCSAANSGTNATWNAAALLLHGDMIALGTISGDRITANTEISAPFIKGGRIEIGGAGGTFSVANNGAVTIKSSTSGARLEIINDRLQVYDENSDLAVRIGRLS